MENGVRVGGGRIELLIKKWGGGRKPERGNLKIDICKSTSKPNQLQKSKVNNRTVTKPVLD
jgi:hypothetical protein